MVWCGGDSFLFFYGLSLPSLDTHTTLTDGGDCMNESEIRKNESNEKGNMISFPSLRMNRGCAAAAAAGARRGWIMMEGWSFPSLFLFFPVAPLPC